MTWHMLKEFIDMHRKEALPIGHSAAKTKRDKKRASDYCTYLKVLFSTVRPAFSAIPWSPCPRMRSRYLLETSDWKTHWEVAGSCYTVASRRLVGSLEVTSRILVQGLNVQVYVTQRLRHQCE